MAKRKPVSKERIKLEDDRRVPLRDFFFERYKELRGEKLLTDKSDWNQFEKMLKQTEGMEFEKLKNAAELFLTSDKPFHTGQGHPLRFWAGNLNAFLGNGKRFPEWQIAKMCWAIVEVRDLYVGAGEEYADERKRVLKARCAQLGVAFSEPLFREALKRL